MTKNLPPIDQSWSNFSGGVQNGRARVLVDGAVALDATEGDLERGDEFFGMGSVEICADVQLEAGRAVEVTIEFSSLDAALLAGVRIGLTDLRERDLLGEAEALAAESDVAIVVVGTNDDWETEGRDRDHFDLPGDQVELIRRVSAVNPRTVVVVNAGGPHALDWLMDPAATLSIGFAGQELGDALVDVLVGDVDPGGRMPSTIPARYEHSPSYLNYPGENSVVRYGEGLYVGHRWFDARHIAPAVAFGHGLSYAHFTWGPPVVAAVASTTMDEPVVVEVDVTNTSDRVGSEVVQVYVEPPPSVLHRPVRELKGFAKLHLGPGETGTAVVPLDRRAFAYFDPADPAYESLAPATMYRPATAAVTPSQVGTCSRAPTGSSWRDPRSTTRTWRTSGSKAKKPAPTPDP
ncbi:MAG: glycoside hydrolase family 3 C-terminal domain-containing protein, partial [Acidimicrobiales bacterium]